VAATLEQAYQSHQEESVQFSWTTVAAPQVVIMDGKPGAATARALATKAAHVDKRPMLYKAFVLEGYQENQDTKARRTVQRFCPCEMSKQQAIEVSVSFRLVSGHASAIRPEPMYSCAVDSCHGPATLNGFLACL
jgi:hypothetical protein